MTIACDGGSIVPNLLLSLHPDYMTFHTLWPEAPHRNLIVCEWLFHPDAFALSAFDPRRRGGVLGHDESAGLVICERSQRGIASLAYRPGSYSARESVVAAWDREYLRVMGEVPRGAVASPRRTS